MYMHCNKFTIILPRLIYKTRQTNVIVENMICTQLDNASMIQKNTLLACSVKPNSQYMWAYQVLIPSLKMRTNSRLVLACSVYNILTFPELWLLYVSIN